MTAARLILRKIEMGVPRIRIDRSASVWFRAVGVVGDRKERIDMSPDQV
jgi:hypothetical protein